MNATVADVVPVFDYLRQHRALAVEVEAAVRRVFASGRLVLGPEGEAFERAFADHLAPGGHGVGVGNGTDALALALRALEVGPGHEVITVANTAIPTVSAIRLVGATPVFVDVDAKTALLDLDALPAAITPRTRAVVPVHLFGNAMDMDRLGEIARAHGLRVVEDCAQSTGATWHGRATGTFGDVGCFSFYPTKNLGAYGDGGFCYTRNPALAGRLRELRFYGCGETYHAVREGMNSRLDEVQAAVLGVKLPHLDRWIEKRRAIAAHYHDALDPRVERVAVNPGAGHAFHLFVVQVPDRDALQARLRDAGVGTGVHYPVPIHCMEGYAFLSVGKGALPVTEQLAHRVLSLPCFPELTFAEVERVSDAVNRVVAHA